MTFDTGLDIDRGPGGRVLSLASGAAQVNGLSGIIPRRVLPKSSRA